MICPVCGRENREDARFCDECATGLYPEDSQDVALENLQGLGSGFVGRHQEMAQLLAALEDARAGRGRMVMLAGEPGIGKTTTAEELTAVAAAQNCQILWGRCHEGEGAPPYWPWLQPLREYVHKASPDQILTQMGSGAADIGEIVPELRTKLPDLEAPPALEAEQARFRLFDSITKFLKNASFSQPMVLVLDDLHWADRSSLLLLEFLARDIQSTPLLVIGTYRDVEVSRRHPLSETLGTLIRSQGFLRLHLTGLGEPEVAQLIQKATEGAPPPGLSAAIHRRTDGNPLFIGEIISMLPQDAKKQEADYLGTIPEGVRDAIGRRLNRLSEDCNHTLTIASVLGQEFKQEQLVPLLEGWTSARLLEAMEEALSARVIEELTGVGRYHFAHALIQETLIEELSLTRRVQLHATIAESLETLYGADPELHAAELAFHFAEAQSILGVESLVRYSLMAGEQALDTYAYEEASRHFERGLAAKGISLSGDQPARTREEAAMLLGLGRAMGATADRRRVNEIEAYVTRAFHYYEEAGDIQNAVEAASFDFFAWNTGYIASNMIELVERALRLVPEDSHDAGYLWAHYIRMLGQTKGDYKASKEATQNAIDIADRENDVELKVRSLAIAANMDSYHLQFEECQKNGTSAIELADQVEDKDSVVRAHYFVGVSSARLGDVPRARWHGEEMLKLLDKPLRNQQHTLTFFLNQYLAYLEGDWSTAREFADRGLSVNTLASVPYLLGVIALTEYETGNAELGDRMVENLLENLRRFPAGASWEYVAAAAVLPIAARITGRNEHSEVASNAATEVLAAQNLGPWIAHHAHIGGALLALQKKESEEALREDYAQLAGTIGMPSLFGTTAERILGLICCKLGDLNQAVIHFEKGSAFCRRAGYRPELAWSCCDYADTLLQRNEAGDHEKALSLLEESLAISTELGMRPLMERVRSRLGSLDSVMPAEAGYPDGLTQREVEVLRIITQGKSNREIGDELVIAESTVRRHVSNIYDKIGVSNRTEAARFALAQGLVALEESGSSNT